LSFIHSARWALVTELPGGKGKDARLPATYLLFDTNFNGDFGTYIDAFCDVVALRLWYFWRGGYGFPGVTPSDRFKEYIRDQEQTVELYLSAYPEAATTVVLSALT